MLRRLIALACLLVPSAAFAQDAPSAPERHSDYLFPKAGDLSLSLATGIPFLAMSEVAVGITNRFSIGGIAGIAMSGDGPPTNVGFGLRPRVDVWHSHRWRVEAVVPVLYYPKTNGTWFLTRPAVQVERTWESGWRAYGGVGVVAVVSEDALTGNTKPGESVLPYGGTPGQKAGDASNGIWNTLSVGGALPLGKKTSVFGEGVLVLNGYKLPGQEWVGGVPFVLTLGITTTL